MTKKTHQATDDRNHRIGFGIGEWTAEAEVIVNIDDDSDGVHFGNTVRIAPQNVNARSLRMAVGIIRRDHPPGIF